MVSPGQSPPQATRPPQTAPAGRSGGLREALVRFWRTEDRFLSVLRDISVAGAVVLLVMALIWGYTGQAFPAQAPIVVVESGSMMHQDDLAPYGRLGTIDPGDLILVKAVSGPGDVEGYYDAEPSQRYDARGDVIIYRPFGSPQVTPIIHRAMAWIEAENGPNGVLCYTYRVEGTLHECADSVTIAEIGINNYKPTHSGFLTKGDNPVTNGRADQVLGGVHAETVRAEWIIGKARGEIPWFGLIKLALYGNCKDDPDCRALVSLGWCNVMRAAAPCDLWTMLYVSLGTLIALPIAVDVAVHVRRRRSALR